MSVLNFMILEFMLIYRKHAVILTLLDNFSPRRRIPELSTYVSMELHSGFGLLLDDECGVMMEAHDMLNDLCMLSFNVAAMY